MRPFHGAVHSEGDLHSARLAWLQEGRTDLRVGRSASLQDFGHDELIVTEPARDAQRFGPYICESKAVNDHLFVCNRAVVDRLTVKGDLGETSSRWRGSQDEEQASKGYGSVPGVNHLW